MKAPANYVVDAGFQDHTGYEAMKQLLQVNPLPDGVFCYNDPVAIGAMKALLEAGLRVPEDVAVVGAGNVHYSDALAVPLTTIDQKTREIGARAAGLLLEQIESKRPPRAAKSVCSGAGAAEIDATPRAHGRKPKAQRADGGVELGALRGRTVMDATGVVELVAEFKSKKPVRSTCPARVSTSWP